jgi:hypothetical protein
VLTTLIALAVTAETRPVRVVYFHPSDYPPLAGYEPRLNKALRYIEAYYADQMAQNGFGRKTFRADRDASGRLRIILAKGELPLAEHGRGKSEPSMHKVADEAVVKAGFDPQNETVLIVSNLLVWKDGKALEVGPYYGSGSTRQGMCCVYDDPRLDPDLLVSKEPGAWYGTKPCTVGEFNTHYLGGIAHELGHAFGLPHERETPTDRKAKGVSIMGPGNHFFGEERRKAGPGAFLTAAAALPLSLHPCFVPGKPAAPIDVSRTLEFPQLNVDQEDGSLVISGRLQAAPAVTGIVAYDDPDTPSDDDSQTRIAKVGGDGTFYFKIPPPVPGIGGGGYNLRLAFYHRDGEPTRRSATFRRNADGTAPLATIKEDLQKVRRGRR